MTQRPPYLGDALLTNITAAGLNKCVQDIQLSSIRMNPCLVCKDCQLFKFDFPVEPTSHPQTLLLQFHTTNPRAGQFVRDLKLLPSRSYWTVQHSWKALPKCRLIPTRLDEVEAQKTVAFLITAGKG
jgi:hypothetical protein